MNSLFSTSPTATNDYASFTVSAGGDEPNTPPAVVETNTANIAEAATKLTSIAQGTFPGTFTVSSSSATTATAAGGKSRSPTSLRFNTTTGGSGGSNTNVTPNTGSLNPFAADVGENLRAGSPIGGFPAGHGPFSSRNASMLPPYMNAHNYAAAPPEMDDVFGYSAASAGSGPLGAHLHQQHRRDHSTHSFGNNSSTSLRPAHPQQQRLHQDFKALSKEERKRVVEQEAAEGDLLARTVHLRFLPTSMLQSELAAICTDCGPYLRVRICGNSTNNQNWIYGFVEFATREGAANMMKKCGMELHNGPGRPPLRLKCNSAKQPIVDRVFHDADPATNTPCIFGLGNFAHRSIKDALDSYFNLKEKEAAQAQGGRVSPSSLSGGGAAAGTTAATTAAAAATAALHADPAVASVGGAKHGLFGATPKLSPHAKAFHPNPTAAAFIPSEFTLGSSVAEGTATTATGNATAATGVSTLRAPAPICSPVSCGTEKGFDGLGGTYGATASSTAAGLTPNLHSNSITQVPASTGAGGYTPVLGATAGVGAFTGAGSSTASSHPLFGTSSAGRRTPEAVLGGIGGASVSSLGITGLLPTAHVLSGTPTFSTAAGYSTSTTSGAAADMHAHDSSHNAAMTFLHHRQTKSGGGSSDGVSHRSPSPMMDTLVLSSQAAAGAGSAMSGGNPATVSGTQHGRSLQSTTTSTNTTTTAAAAAGAGATPATADAASQLTLALEAMLESADPRSLRQIADAEEVLVRAEALAVQSVRQCKSFVASGKDGFYDAIGTLKSLRELLEKNTAVFEMPTSPAPTSATTRRRITGLNHRATQLRLLANLLAALLYMGRRSFTDALPFIHAIVTITNSIPATRLLPAVRTHASAGPTVEEEEIGSPIGAPGESRERRALLSAAATAVPNAAAGAAVGGRQSTDRFESLASLRSPNQDGSIPENLFRYLGGTSDDVLKAVLSSLDGDEHDGGDDRDDDDETASAVNNVSAATKSLQLCPDASEGLSNRRDSPSAASGSSGGFYNAVSPAAAFATDEESRHHQAEVAFHCFVLNTLVTIGLALEEVQQPLVTRSTYALAAGRALDILGQQSAILNHCLASSASSSGTAAADDKAASSRSKKSKKAGLSSGSSSSDDSQTDRVMLLSELMPDLAARLRDVAGHRNGLAKFPTVFFTTMPFYSSSVSRGGSGSRDDDDDDDDEDDMAALWGPMLPPQHLVRVFPSVWTTAGSSRGSPGNFVYESE